MECFFFLSTNVIALTMIIYLLIEGFIAHPKSTIWYGITTFATEKGKSMNPSYLLNAISA